MSYEVLTISEQDHLLTTQTAWDYVVPFTLVDGSTLSSLN